MDLTPYVDLLRQELATAASAGGEEVQSLAERLVAPLDSAVRLAMLEALSAATAEITRDLAPGSVHVRLNGRDPDFVVTTAPAEALSRDVATGVPEAFPDPAEKGATSRINLRLPDDVKIRVEEAAGRERISVNAWLVRAALAALDPGSGARPGASQRGSSGGQRFTGWAK